MKPINRILFSMMYWEMLSAAVFPCQCEKDMQIKYLSSLPGKIWQSMQGANIAMAVENFRSRGYALLEVLS